KTSVSVQKASWLTIKPVAPTPRKPRKRPPRREGMRGVSVLVAIGRSLRDPRRCHRGPGTLERQGDAATRGLPHDRTRHLRSSICPVSERDRDFYDAHTRAAHRVHALHLEAVSVALRPLIEDQLDRLAVVHAEATGDVLRGQPEQPAREQTGTARQDTPLQRPALRPPPARVARAEGKIR